MSSNNSNIKGKQVMWNRRRRRDRTKTHRYTHTQRNLFQLSHWIYRMIFFPFLIELIFCLCFYFVSLFARFRLLAQILFYFKEHKYICGDAHVYLSTACRFRWHSMKRICFSHSHSPHENNGLSAATTTKHTQKHTMQNKIYAQIADRKNGVNWMWNVKTKIGYWKQPCSFLLHYGSETNMFGKISDFSTLEFFNKLFACRSTAHKIESGDLLFFFQMNKKKGEMRGKAVAESLNNLSLGL